MSRSFDLAAAAADVSAASLAGTIGYTDEQALDAIGAALRGSQGLSLVFSDAADTITVKVSDSAALRLALSLVAGTDVQAYSPTLAQLAVLAMAADCLPYFTGAAGAGTTPFTALGRSLAGASTATIALAAMGVTLGYGAGNVPTLDAGGKLLASAMPSIAVDQKFSVASQAAMLALVAEIGDIAVRTDFTPPRRYMLSDSDPSVADNWAQIVTPLDVVSSFANLKGDITQAQAKTALAYTPADIGAQPAASVLTLLAGLAPAADRLPYFTGAGAAGVTTLSAFIRTLLDDADAATALATLGAQPAANGLTQLAALTGGSKFAFRAANGTWVVRGLGTGLSDDGTSINASASGGDMYKADNLAGLGDLPTARSNIGLAIAAVADWFAGTAAKVMTVANYWLSKAPTALSNAAASVPFDMSTGINFTLTLANNHTLAAPTNAKVGQEGWIRIQQGSTAPTSLYTLSFASAYRFDDNATAPSLNVGTNAVTLLYYQVTAAGEVTLSRGKPPVTGLRQQTLSSKDGSPAFYYAYEAQTIEYTYVNAGSASGPSVSRTSGAVSNGFTALNVPASGGSATVTLAAGDILYFYVSSYSGLLHVRRTA